MRDISGDCQGGRHANHPSTVGSKASSEKSVKSWALSTFPSSKALDLHKQTPGPSPPPLQLNFTLSPSLVSLCSAKDTIHLGDGPQRGKIASMSPTTRAVVHQSVAQANLLSTTLVQSLWCQPSTLCSAPLPTSCDCQQTRHPSLHHLVAKFSRRTFISDVLPPRLSLVPTLGRTTRLLQLGASQMPRST